LLLPYDPKGGTSEQARKKSVGSWQLSVSPQQQQQQQQQRANCVSLLVVKVKLIAGCHLSQDHDRSSKLTVCTLVSGVSPDTHVHGETLDEVDHTFHACREDEIKLSIFGVQQQG
jgi:hypothetical protein